MRIAVFGTGGVGGFFGAQLTRAGRNVALLARGAHLDAIREKGLCVTSPEGEILARPSIATDDPAAIGEVDVVLLGVKAEQVPDIGPELKPLLGADSFVVPLQNGVEAAGQLISAIGESHVVGGLCGTVSWVAAPGHIRTLSDVNFIRFGELDNRPSERTDALRRAFAATSVKAEIPDDIHRAAWEKFLFVVSLGGVAAMRDAPFGIVRQDEEARRLLELAMREILALARSRGVAMDAAIVERTMGFVDTLPESGTASLQRDIAAGKPSELEAWNGAVVRLARESGVEVPVHTTIYETLLPREQRARAAS